MLVYFISHPEVQVDPHTPITQWDLSATGKERLEKMLAIQPWVSKIKAIFSSTETKARTTAKRLAEVTRAPLQKQEALGEIDRSATGFLPPTEFEHTVATFFTESTESIRGWETAVAAQTRIVQVVESILQTVPDQTIAIVAHGGVGTLLKCHLQAKAISQQEDQPGQGYYFVFDGTTKKLISDWQAIDRTNGLLL